MLKARKSSTDQDITQVSVAQLARLTAKILRLHLASRHLSTTGTKATMARRLHDTIHAPDAPAQRHSVDSSVAQPQQDATLTLHQQSDGPVSFQQQGTQQQQGTSFPQSHLLPPRNWQGCSANSSAKLSLARPCLLPDNHRHLSHQLQLMSHCPWFSLKPNCIPTFNRDNHSKASQ